MINFWLEVEPDLDLHVGGRNDEADGGVRRVSVLEKNRKKVFQASAFSKTSSAEEWNDEVEWKELEGLFQSFCWPLKQFAKIAIYTSN